MSADTTDRGHYSRKLQIIMMGMSLCGPAHVVLTSPWRDFNSLAPQLDDREKIRRGKVLWDQNEPLLERHIQTIRELEQLVAGQGQHRSALHHEASMLLNKAIEDWKAIVKSIEVCEDLVKAARERMAG